MNWTINKLQQAREALSDSNNNIHAAAKFLREKWHKTVTADDIVEAMTESMVNFPDKEVPPTHTIQTQLPLDTPQPATSTVTVADHIPASWQSYRPRVGLPIPTPSPSSRIITSTEIQRGIIIPDSHHPLVDKKANGVALGIVKDCQPHFGVIIGDYGDLESLSKHPKTKPDMAKLANEYLSMNLALDELQNASPNTKWVFIEGNHERRAKKFSADLGMIDGMLDVAENLFLVPRKNGYFRNSSATLPSIPSLPY